MAFQVGGCIVVRNADYNPNSHKLSLEATTPTGYDPNVTLTTSPGGQMQPHPPGNPDHYRLTITLQGTCPCDVTITSSDGGTTTVTVGP
ncbi:MAG: hypothetical protein R3E31_29335 [Chloroflexota bacterium]